MASVILWTVTLGLLAQFVVSPGVLGATVDGGDATGSTYNSALIGCSADVTLNRLPSVLDVNIGDDVRFYFYVNWDDDRPSQQPIYAQHRFIVTATYSGMPYSDDLDVYTWGNEEGSDTLYAEIPNVSESTQVTNIQWTAINQIPGLCYDWDLEGPYLYRSVRHLGKSSDSPSLLSLFED
jgi:hypothetical protein